MICKQCGGNIPDTVEVCPTCGAYDTTSDQAAKPVRQILSTKSLVLLVALLAVVAVAAVFLIPMFFGGDASELPIAEKAVQARQLLSDKDYDAAVSAFDDILQSDPDNIDAMLGKSEALRALDKTADAEKLYEQAMQFASARAELQGSGSASVPQTTTAVSSAESESAQTPEESVPDLGDPVPDELYELPAGKKLSDDQKVSADDQRRLTRYVQYCAQYFSAKPVPAFDDFSRLNKEDALRIALGCLANDPLIKKGGGEMDGEYYFAPDNVEALAKKYVNASFRLYAPESYDVFVQYENGFGMPCSTSYRTYVEDIYIEDGRYQVLVSETKEWIEKTDDYVALPRAVYTIELSEDGHFNLCGKKYVSADHIPDWVRVMQLIGNVRINGENVLIADIDEDGSNELIIEVMQTNAAMASGVRYEIRYSKTLPCVGYYTAYKHNETGEIYYKLDGGMASMGYFMGFTAYLDPDGNRLMREEQSGSMTETGNTKEITYEVNGEKTTAAAYKKAERDLQDHLTIVDVSMTPIDEDDVRSFTVMCEFFRLRFAD